MKTTQMYIEYVIAGFVLLLAISFTILDISLHTILFTHEMWDYRKLMELLPFLHQSGSHIAKIRPSILIPAVFGISAILGVVAVSFGYREGAKTPFFRKTLWFLYGVTSEKELAQYYLIRTILTKPSEADIAHKYLKKPWSTPILSVVLTILIMFQTILFFTQPNCECTVWFGRVLLVLLILTFLLFFFSMIGKQDNFMDGFLLTENGLKGRFLNDDVHEEWKSFFCNGRRFSQETKIRYYDIRSLLLKSGNIEVINQFKSRWMQARMAGILILPLLLLCQGYTVFFGCFSCSNLIASASGTYYKIHCFWLIATSIQVLLVSLFWTMIVVYKRRVFFMVKFLLDHTLD